MGSIILNTILLFWFGCGAWASVLDYIYESRRKGEVSFNLDIICDMALCLILGVFSLAAVIVWEKEHTVCYK
jgi:hypothetical protein